MKEDKGPKGQGMITTNKICLVKEGYLDVKVPPENRERKLWKAWQRRWLVSQSVAEPFGLELQIHGCQKTSNSQPLWTIFISPESGKLFRSRSRTHAAAFSVAHETVVLLHLAGESEQLSQSWMASIRDVLWPPSPIVQVEAAFQDVHRVSIIDDENTFRSELFGAYGHLYMAGEVILLMSTHSGRLIKEWRLDEVLNAQVVRLDEGKTSGVFSLTLKSASSSSSQQVDKLHFYSQTAVTVVGNISAALKMRRESKASSSSQTTLKYDSGIQELSELLSLEIKVGDNGKPFDSDNWSSKELPEGLTKLAAMSGDFLNCSINSVFSPHSTSPESRTSSEASSDYSPPVSPMDPISSNQDSILGNEKTRRNSKDLFDYFYCDTDVKVRRNSLEDIDIELYADLMASFRPSTASGIYADITSLPPSKRPSLAETLYEDIEEDEEGFVKLMDEIMEDEYMPPLPPPRNTNTCDRPIERTPNRAKRPSSLGLENLSSSICETLSQMQTPITFEPNCKTNKRSFPAGLFKPIKGVKKILGNRKSVKSPPESPVKQCNALTSYNSPPETCETANSQSYPLKPLLIMNVDDASEPVLNGDLDNDNHSDIKNSPTLISDEDFVPFPELLTSAAGRKEEPLIEHNEEIKRCKDFSSTETSSAVLRDGKIYKQTRSCDSLLVESLKSKYSCHRQFLEFLQIYNNGNNSHNLVAHTYKQNCISRSLSLEQFPSESPYGRRHSHCNSEAFSHDLYKLLQNDSYSAVNSADPCVKTAYLQGIAFQHLLERRRSSDYCVMNSAVASNISKEPEMCKTLCDQNGETEIKQEPLSHAWLNTLEKQETEQESLYMDMTVTTK